MRDVVCHVVDQAIEAYTAANYDETSAATLVDTLEWTTFNIVNDDEQLLHRVRLLNHAVALLLLHCDTATPALSAMRHLPPQLTANLRDQYADNDDYAADTRRMAINVVLTYSALFTFAVSCVLCDVISTCRNPRASTICTLST